MHAAGGLWCVLSTPGTAVLLHGWTALFNLSFPACLFSFFQHELSLGGSNDAQRINIGNTITSLTDNLGSTPGCFILGGVLRFIIDS